ncbi:YqaE/Pmp3 family membrane protein [Oecophyllibacter saccharovorans]|uniref:YqaE/Pmp3 family membrane protein n=1 Tax=Oecophyllibacter saccharovorans TaxID=2558360 RepID=A0A506US16_9PROT|nr:YqaE/Pmp3 family membrane protein [Oecophyllibacter saccharovorans]QDH14966.1 YqaE/Pmp3 family membrane protein [Oecophyllibacter saccharovorans]TPW35152.1 YqaE/Pmp3 family membrane protein [Oecophyllibacter saccharovorans]TPW36102.1 YqaE/Pmp3 family membrane protein [Oecophyllibacter saccharovorans]
MLRVLIAFFAPWLTFFTIGRPIAGIVCLLLQVFLIGWPIAAIWAFMALRKYDLQTGAADALRHHG